ncbi:thioesterase [Streptomyces actinomycinicus]|uniref:Thioesterase n=1 Tax=Streptomyces actinomycinicus TaxID=1695166 RepID=A0A937EIL1_9ACTN|nr:alpha/beta fold hydrolase [Streptomyces actinomycinicus]MBL1082709.1 thioesterase [Streptomyces actinomycinicus]
MIKSGTRDATRDGRAKAPAAALGARPHGTGALRRLGSPAASSRDEGRVSLVCFPYAGGGSTAYTAWRRRLPEALTLHAHIPPGREERGREPSLGSVDELVDDVLPDVLAVPGPLVLVGHSFGAFLAHETAHRLAQAGRPPEHLFVLGAGAPGLTPLQPVGNDEEIERLWRLLGANPAGLERPEFRAGFFPALRADLRAHAAFLPPADRPALTLPVTAVYGNEDPVATEQAVSTWRHLCSGPFRTVEIAGGHFFPQTRVPDTIDALVRDLDIAVT